MVVSRCSHYQIEQEDNPPCIYEVHIHFGSLEKIPRKINDILSILDSQIEMFELWKNKIPWLRKASSLSIQCQMSLPRYLCQSMLLPNNNVVFKGESSNSSMNVIKALNLLFESITTRGYKPSNLEDLYLGEICQIKLWNVLYHAINFNPKPLVNISFCIRMDVYKFLKWKISKEHFSLFF